MTYKTISTYIAGGYSLKPNYAGLLITATGGVGGTGVYAVASAIVTNYGTIHGSFTGIILHEGGEVFNAGTIVGGIYAEYGPGRLQNSGVLVSNSADSVNFSAGGYVLNFRQGKISGTPVAIGGSAGKVVNFGLMDVHVGLGGGTITNGATSDPGAMISNGVAFSGFVGTVVNFGTIDGYGYGPYVGAFLAHGGTVVNGALTDTAARIAGTDGVEIYGSARTTNFGTIVGQTGSAGYDGVRETNGGTVTNGAVSDRVALIEGYTGIAILGSAGSIANFGTIAGQGSAGTQDGVYLQGGGQVSNGAAGDFAAVITGATGVDLAAIGTVANFGTIDGAYASAAVLAGGGRVNNYGVIEGATGGVWLNGAGGVVNGSGGDKTALIQTFGGDAVSLYGSGFLFNYGTVVSAEDLGVYVAGGGSVINFGVIQGDRGGVQLTTAGTVTNGYGVGSTDLITAFSGNAVSLEAAGRVINYGTIASTEVFGVYLGASGATVSNLGVIAGGLGGVYLNAGGAVTNGSLTDRTALIEGASGVAVLGAAGTINNFATIQATNNYPGVRLVAGGLVTNGTVNDAGALIEGLNGVSLSGGASVRNFAVVSGLGGLETGGVIAYGGSGSMITNGAVGDANALIEGYIGVGAYGTAASVTVTNFGTIAGTAGTAVTLKSSTDVLVVEAGSAFQGAVLGGGGTLELATGTGTLSGFGGGKITVSGSMAATTFQAFNTIKVDGGATFAGTGSVTIASGQTVNDFGVLRLGGPGAASIVNAGLIETSLAGILTLAGAVANTGTILVNAGTLTVTGAVTGNGHATLGGGTLDLASSFTQNVTFTAGVTAVLELGHSQSYTGSITGLSKTGKTSLDLVDIGFVSASEATYSGTAAAGVLTVTDGTHTAHINLKGNYTTSTFITSSDGHGGTIVVDPNAKPLTAPLSETMMPAPHAFIDAMASFGARGAPLELGAASRLDPRSCLLAVHPQAA